MSVTDAIDILEQLVDELGGRDALSLDKQDDRSTGDAMAALFDEPQNEVEEGPFLGEGDDVDDAVAPCRPRTVGNEEGDQANEAFLAGASVDDSMDFWNELDEGQGRDQTINEAEANEEHAVEKEDSE